MLFNVCYGTLRMLTRFALLKGGHLKRGPLGMSNPFRKLCPLQVANACETTGQGTSGLGDDEDGFTIITLTMYLMKFWAGVPLNQVTRRPSGLSRVVPSLRMFLSSTMAPCVHFGSLHCNRRSTCCRDGRISSTFLSLSGCRSTKAAST